MHTQASLHLTDEQVTYIEDILSNDENATDEELIELFSEQINLFEHQALKVLEHRQNYRLNIYIGNDTPIRNGTFDGYPF